MICSPAASSARGVGSGVGAGVAVGFGVGSGRGVGEAFAAGAEQQDGGQQQKDDSMGFVHILILQEKIQKHFSTVPGPWQVRAADGGREEAP